MIKKVKCDRPTDRPTDKAGCRVACTRLKRIFAKEKYFCEAEFNFDFSRHPDRSIGHRTV